MRDLTYDGQLGLPCPSQHGTNIKATLGHPTWQVGQVLFCCQGSDTTNIAGLLQTFSAIIARNRRLVFDGRTDAAFIPVHGFVAAFAPEPQLRCGRSSQKAAESKPWRTAGLQDSCLVTLLSRRLPLLLS